MNAVWITWEQQRRNRSVSSRLGWPLHALVHDDKPRVVRYLTSLIETINILRRRPSVVAVQNPSLVLAVLAVLLRRIFGYRLVVDAHNNGITPLEGKSAVLNHIARSVMRRADITIVTNANLARVVTESGGHPAILPDPLPAIPDGPSEPLDGRIRVLCVCGYHADEPYMELLAAAPKLPADARLYLTGRPPRTLDQSTLAPNVTLLGFVSEERYLACLRAADIVVDLTLREDCLVCGAYEATALDKPMVLSNTAALRELFGTGTVFTAPSAEAIAAAIVQATLNLRALGAAASARRVRVEQITSSAITSLQAQVEALLTSTTASRHP